MQIAPFDLERWFAEVEHDADIMLAESGVRSLEASEFDTDPGKLGYVIPTNGDPQLRERIGSLHDRSADETLLTCGAQEANLLAFLSVMGEHAVAVTPTYGSLTALPDSLGEVTTVPLKPGSWSLDPEAVIEAIRPETAVVVINNPNNPTGRYHDAERVRAVYEACADAGVYLLCDEVYRLLSPDPAPPVASYGRYGISTGSLSKAFGLAGLRFGWLCGPRSVVETAWNWKDYTTISTGIIDQHVAEQAFERSDELLTESRQLATEHREIVAAFVSEHGLSWYEPDCSVNAFVEVPGGFATGSSFCRRLVEEESVVLAPGDAFGHPDRFRIGYGLERSELEEGLERVGAFLERHA